VNRYIAILLVIILSFTSAISHADDSRIDHHYDSMLQGKNSILFGNSVLDDRHTNLDLLKLPTIKKPYTFDRELNLVMRSLIFVTSDLSLGLMERDKIISPAIFTMGMATSWSNPPKVVYAVRSSAAYDLFEKSFVLIGGMRMLFRGAESFKGSYVFVPIVLQSRFVNIRFAQGYADMSFSFTF